MSYTYLLEQGEESSAECFSDIAPYVLSRLNHIQGASCFKGSETASYRGSQSGMMSAPSMGSRGEELWMSSAEDSHARIYPQQADQIERDWRENEADYGLRCSGSFARWDPESYSWKTAQLSLFGGLESFSENWPRWGMMRDGECSLLETLEHDTSVREFGSSPIIGTPLKTQRGRSDEFRSPALNPFELCPKGFLPSPTWVEKLMGWPIGWTDLQPLGMDKFQEWHHAHSIFSPANAEGMARELAAQDSESPTKQNG
jgi:hypothetical protein